MSAERDAFIAKYSQDVIDATCGTGIFPSVKMAQMIIESANSQGQAGQGITARLANNFFGIKANTAWTGEKMAFNTPNDAKPVSYFRVYKTVKDSIADHTKFLQVNSRYKTAGVFTAKTPEEQTDALAKAGYSEKPYPQYATGLNAMIKGYNLKKLDSGCLKKK
jgi:mannosyl-glycoprotein endo-beta-N-acetylglucosaminidase/stage II sporulation protein P